jgi:asparagine synthase (glutamine-hydrolysing)
MQPIKRGFALIVTPPGTRSENELASLLRGAIRRLPRSEAAEPVIWIDAEAGIAIGIPEETESPAAISLLRTLPGDITFAVTGMHGRLETLRKLVDDGDTRSSADVLSAAVASLGADRIIAQSDDPLAFAIWNGRDRTVTVSRDRVGHVPVFYGRTGRDLVIATHLRAFDAHPNFRDELDLGALGGLLRHRTAPLPSTIFRDVRQLFPGTRLTITNTDRELRFETEEYWSLAAVHRAGIEDRSRATPEEISLELQRLLKRSIDRSLNDQSSPVGMFFSAGIDSNLVAAVATTTSHPVRTMTSRFDNADTDDGPGADVMAARLGTEHTTFTFDAEQIFDVVQRSSTIYGQPHGDQAGLPAILMAEALADSVPLIITGDGGNDLLGSNRSLEYIFPLLSMHDRIPQPLHRPLSLLAGTSARGVELIETVVDRVAPNSKAAKLRSGGFRRIAATLAATNPEHLYGIRSSHNPFPQRYIDGMAEEVPATYRNPDRWLRGGDRHDRWRHAEFSQISIEVEGSKQEGAITAAGAGYRASLLDPEIIRFAFRVPDSVRDKDGVDRWPSVDVVRRLAPAGAAMPVAGGFGVPTDKWLRNELRPWAEDLLSESNLRATGIFNVKAVRMEWRQHLSGLHDRRYVLWPILMTLTWLDARKHRSS